MNTKELLITGPREFIKPTDPGSKMEQDHGTITNEGTTI